MRLLAEPGSKKKDELEVELDADRDRVVDKGNEGTARMRVRVKRVERDKHNKEEVIADLNQSQGGMCICRRLRIGPGGSQERLTP